MASICLTNPHGRATFRTRTFGTTTPDLLDLQAWLAGHRVTHVAMEATGFYWKPVYNLLEGPFTTWVANPAHIARSASCGSSCDRQVAVLVSESLTHANLLVQVW